MKLDNNNHSVFLMYYHLVLVVKYRRKVFTDKMSNYAKDIFVRIGKSYNITLEEWDHDVDHIHIIITDFESLCFLQCHHHFFILDIIISSLNLYIFKSQYFIVILLVRFSIIFSSFCRLSVEILSTGQISCSFAGPAPYSI